MSSLYSFLIGALAAVLVFASGYESGKTAERERMNEVITQEQIKHAKSLADATNSIELASTEYNTVRSERDRLLERLRIANSGSRKDASVCVDAGRVTALERMVRDLSDMAARCDSGWNGCARRKDALVEAVK